MTFTEVQQILSILTPLAMVIVFWRMGGNTASTQVIATYKEQVNQLQGQVATLTKQVGEMGGILKEKNERIKTLEAIATNRNPEMETFIKKMMNQSEEDATARAAAKDYMERTSRDLHSIKNHLTKTKLVDNKKTRKGGETHT
jgi:proline dehydrogenase